MRVATGVTLVELAIGLVVVAVIVAIAIPVHRVHRLRSARHEAINALQHIQTAEEGFFVAHDRYTAALTAQPPLGLGLTERSASGRYQLSVEVSDGGNLLGFAARAHVRPGSAAADDPICRSFSLDQNGLRSARDDAGHDETTECWR